MSGTEALIRRYWDRADRRDWEGFTETLFPDVVHAGRPGHLVERL